MTSGRHWVWVMGYGCLSTGTIVSSLTGCCLPTWNPFVCQAPNTWMRPTIRRSTTSSNRAGVCWLVWYRVSSAQGSTHASFRWIFTKYMRLFPSFLHQWYHFLPKLFLVFPKSMDWNTKQYLNMEISIKKNIRILILSKYCEKGFATTSTCKNTFPSNLM